MRINVNVLCLLLTTAVLPSSFAQNIRDGVFPRDKNLTRDPIPYAHLREADVMWATRVWRKLDLREKMNHPFYFPTESIKDRRSLVQVLIESVDEGSLTAYDPLDDEFTRTLTSAEIDRRLVRIDSIWMEGELPPYEPELVVVEEPFDVGRVKEIRLKEEWFFDKQRSVMDVRIIGIQPVADNIDPETGEVRGKEPMFWVYFPEARNIFANVDVFNRHNDAARWTLDDVFWKRMFGSYIYKIQNVYDRQIADYTLNGLDQMLEAERIKDDIFVMESDLWEY
ncbi:MAG: gliding motility protein GldN [Flavobacteriales bacterium]|nr:gliding motility protein GldN [Flavobacteriales bacterium]